MIVVRTIPAAIRHRVYQRWWRSHAAACRAAWLAWPVGGETATFTVLTWVEIGREVAAELDRIIREASGHG